MIKLTIGTNTKRDIVMVETTDTLEHALKSSKVDVSKCALHLDGTMIAGVDKSKTFDQLGITDGSEAMLVAVVKADSAN